MFSLSTKAQENTSEIKTIAAQSPVESLLPMLAGLLAILMVIFCLAFLLKRFTHFNPATGHIKVLETQRLGAKERLIIVEVQDQQLLLGVTSQNITQLTELKHRVETKKSFTSFDTLMKQMLNPAEFIKAKSANAELKKSNKHASLNNDSHGKFEDS